MVFGRWADCESATQQIASLRYGGSAKMCPTLQGYDTHHPLVYKDCWSLDTRFWKLDCPALSTSHARQSGALRPIQHSHSKSQDPGETIGSHSYLSPVIHSWVALVVGVGSPCDNGLRTRIQW